MRSDRTRARAVASPRARISEMQRARLLAAATASIAELGYAHTSVGHITARARVSRRTFYDLFENREDCLLAILRDASQRISAEIVAADLSALCWRERVRGGLLAILSFLDREPALARVCLVQALQGGPRVLRWREQTLAALARILDEGRAEGSGTAQCGPLTAEGLVGAAFAIAYARCATDRRREPLADLTGELMSLIVLPYLGPGAARRELRETRTSSPRRRGAAVANGAERSADPHPAPVADPLAEVPMRLTYRTARVLEVIGRAPGASNRVVAEHAGIADQGQVSKLLARLERIGLLTNTGQGHAKGEPNAWRLTPLGERVARQLSLGTSLQEDAT